jgi:hypothetical protein
MSNTATVPAGYWQDAKGNLIPSAKIKTIDKVQNELVYRLCAMARDQSAILASFKRISADELAAFVSLSGSEYGVQVGGDKGNITLLSFDGKYKLVRQVSDSITFGPQLLAANQLIDNCVHRWAAGANDNIKALVNHAFQTDKTGQINTARVLALRQLDIKDEEWLRAMQAIADSIQTLSSKPYVRFYERDDKTGDYLPIVLNVAAA